MFAITGFAFGAGLSQLSIKTRIETPCLSCQILILFCLSQLSIKTRIETPSLTINLILEVSVWVSYPLKQGLKRKVNQGLKRSAIVWVSYPLKQGLKLHNSVIIGEIPTGLSQLSIKTRIETRTRKSGETDGQMFESAIH